MNGVSQLDNFVRDSLELHLFFARIMKEHSIFLEAGFVGKDAALAQQADLFKTQFADILRNTIDLANGVVSVEGYNSGEWITDKTLQAEQKTQELSGIPIDTSLTIQVSRIAENGAVLQEQLEAQVNALNQRAIALTNELIQFKTNILEGMLQCQLYTFNFPLLIVHIRREAVHYIQQLERLQSNVQMSYVDEVIEEELFWNLQMAEHAQFIRQLLDPTESCLILKAEKFTTQYNILARRVPGNAPNQFAPDMLIRESAVLTHSFRDFKAAGTDGILACQIKSIIIPLLADHVLREANHFLRILNTGY